MRMRLGQKHAHQVVARRMGYVDEQEPKTSGHDDTEMREYLQSRSLLATQCKNCPNRLEDRASGNVQLEEGMGDESCPQG